MKFSKWLLSVCLCAIFTLSSAWATEWVGMPYQSKNSKTTAMVWVNVDSMHKSRHKSANEITYWYVWVNTRNEWGGDETEMGYETTYCSEQKTCVHELQFYDSDYQLSDKRQYPNFCLSSINKGETPLGIVRNLACGTVTSKTKKNFKNIKELIKASQKMIGVRPKPKPF